MLESPTGTGKTLSLLCASLAWLNQNRLNAASVGQSDDVNDAVANDGDVMIHTRLTGKAPKLDPTQMDDQELVNFLKQRRSSEPRIFFSSRTHSQLSQSIKELKKCAYSSNSAVVLGSRDQLCINPEVQKLDTNSAKNQACKAKISGAGKCPYYQNYETKLSDPDYAEKTIFDIEDLVTIGEKRKCCPYFASRKLQDRSDIVFLPYNYLLDPQIRKFQGVDLTNSIVIFDEGHNLEKTCEEAISAEIKSGDIAIIIRELDSMYEYLKKVKTGEIIEPRMNEQANAIEVEDLALLKELLINFEGEVDRDIARLKQAKSKDKEFVHSDNWVFNMLASMDMTLENHRVYLNTIDKVSSLLTMVSAFGASSLSTASNAFDKLGVFLGLLFPSKAGSCYQTFKDNFNVKFKMCSILEEEYQRPKQQSDKGWFTVRDPPKSSKALNWSLNIWCLTPSIGIKSLLDTNVRNIILTSGTLAPLNTFEAEFGVDFPVRLENQHIISPTQMSIFPIGRSFDNTLLDSRYDNKENNKFYRALGNTVVDICHYIPNGVLLFFSSYSVKSNCIQRWKDFDRDWSIWSKLNELKYVFEEPKSRGSFAECIENFRIKVDDSKSSGAIFIGVCRGKLSEGIDLANQYCRAVILVGLPFPALKDPRVVLKKQYIDRIRLPGLSSSEWYVLQMKRALNQAVGRAIRNKNDYGCVFLLDYRFENAVNDLSKWCRNFVVKKQYREMIEAVKQFYDYNSKAVRKQPIAYQSKVVNTTDSKSKSTPNDFKSEYFEQLPTQDVSKTSLFAEYSKKSEDTPGFSPTTYESKSNVKPTNAKSKKTDSRPMFGRSSLITQYLKTEPPKLKPESNNLFDSVFGQATDCKFIDKQLSTATSNVKKHHAPNLLDRSPDNRKKKKMITLSSDSE